jgi:two-component system sensor histidine kinase/response regulator
MSLLRMEQSRLQATLDRRCEAIARSWHAVVAQTGFVSRGAGEAGQQFVKLTGQVIDLLLTDPFDRERAQEIGVSLARFHYVQPDTLGKTQEVLMSHIVEGLSPEQVVALQPRLAALLGGLTAGFAQEMRQVILAEQEQIRGALIAELGVAEKELTDYRDHLEDLVGERTAELISAVEYLEREITERRRVEEMLRRSNRELALLDRASQALTSTLDLDQVLVVVLEEVRRLLGITACSVWLIEPETGEVFCQQATGPQSDVVRGWRLAPREGIAGWVAYSGESVIVADTRADARHFKNVDQQTGVELRSVMSVPLRVTRGVVGAIQVLDMGVGRFGATDLRLLEALAAPAAIAIDNARLVETLRQRRSELEARNEELDAFAGAVAHDLKNPLSIVIGFAETLELEFGDSCSSLSDVDFQTYLRKIARNGRKMEDIIDTLLILARVSDEELEVEALNMGDIVAEAQQRLANMIEEYQADVILPDTWPAVLGYAPGIESVWVNYISNALKYGGQPPRVELGATAQEDDKICFWVRDNGPGLTVEEQARLFRPFTRLGQVRAKGHGLGLFIVRLIVEKLGGQVRVESEVGRGSIFSFTLLSANT